MSKKARRFKRSPHSEKTSQFTCPKSGEAYKVYESKNKKTPAFAGVVKKVETTDTQVKILIEIKSSKTMEVGKTICMSYLLHKNLWSIIKERENFLPQIHKRDKKKHYSNELYKLKAA